MVDSTRSAAFAMPVYIAPPVGSQTQNITTSAGFLLKTGPGVFLGYTVNQAQSGDTLEVLDGTDGTGKVLGTFSTAATGSTTMPAGGFPFATGLFVITAGGTPANTTVMWQ